MGLHYQVHQDSRSMLQPFMKVTYDVSFRKGDKLHVEHGSRNELEYDRTELEAALKAHLITIRGKIRRF